MRRIADCDDDTMYKALEDIGINMRELDKLDPSLQYLQELYGFLLYDQLLAWKSGKSYRTLIRSANQRITSSIPIANRSS
jgi:hypothetical protein